jgi:hypothetical protein
MKPILASGLVDTATASRTGGGSHHLEAYAEARGSEKGKQPAYRVRHCPRESLLANSSYSSIYQKGIDCPIVCISADGCSTSVAL